MMLYMQGGIVHYTTKLYKLLTLIDRITCVIFFFNFLIVTTTYFNKENSVFIDGIGVQGLRFKVVKLSGCQVVRLSSCVKLSSLILGTS